MGWETRVLGLGDDAADAALDMSQQARLQRAREMGFDTDTIYYHGTASDIVSFDPSKLQSRDEGYIGTGVYTTPDARIASHYAKTAKSENVSPNVMPMYAKGGNIKQFSLPEKAEIANRMRNSEMSSQELTDSLRQQGYTGTEVIDGAGNVIERNTFDPVNLRSINAAFDPAKAGSGDLLALNSRQKVSTNPLDYINPKAIPTGEIRANDFADQSWSERVNNALFDTATSLGASSQYAQKIAGVGSTAVEFTPLQSAFDIADYAGGKGDAVSAGFGLLDFVPGLGAIRSAAKNIYMPDGRWIDTKRHMSEKGESIMNIADTGVDARYGKGRKNEAERLNELTVTRDSEGNQILKALTPDDLAGRNFLLSMADRTAAGGAIKEINGVKLKTPINLHGGQGYALDNEGKAWASASGVVSGMINKGKALNPSQLAESNPLLVPFTMAPTGNDFATKTGGTLLSYAQSNMNKRQKRDLNRAIKKMLDKDVAKTFKGVDDEGVVAWFEGLKPSNRKAIQNMMDKDFRDDGGLTLGEARVAVSDASQLNAPDLSAMNIMEYDPYKGRMPSTNPSYDDSLIGFYKGSLQHGFNVSDLVPEYKALRGYDDITKLSPAMAAQEAYSLRQIAPTGKFTDEIIEQMIKRGAFGGER